MLAEARARSLHIPDGVATESLVPGVMSEPIAALEIGIHADP